MTRETKVGLVVACSFLCLVGIVVASKWRRAGTPPTDPEEQQIKVAAVNPKPGTGDTKKPTGDGKGLGVPTPESKEPGMLPRMLIPPPDQNDKTVKDQLEQLTRDALNAKDIKPLSIVPPQEFQDPNNKPLPFPPREEKSDGLPTFQTLEGSKPAPADPLIVFPPTKNEQEKPGITVVPIPLEEKKGEPFIPPLATNELPPLPRDGLPMFPPVENKGPAMPPIVIGPKEPTKPLTPIESPVPPVRFGDEFPKLPTIPSNPLDSPSLPPINVGGTKPATNVNRYDPDIIEVLPNETNFGQLSKRLYGHEKYGDALLAYNRLNGRILNDGASLQASPPRLAQGQRVLRPPVALLERDFAHLFGDQGLIPITTKPGVTLSPPTIGAPPGISAISNPPINTSGSYVVRATGGERIRDIAHRLLGSPDRWTEIYRLNPGVQPQFPIPTGTPLRLPTN